MGRAFAPIYFFLQKKPDGENGKELGIANLAILGVLRFIAMQEGDSFLVLAVTANEQVGQSSAAWGAAEATGKAGFCRGYREPRDLAGGAVGV
jgi:hypothetical protein